jgi:adenine phosphoribosyltransferase
MSLALIQDHIRIVPDFPKPGINFYDIATLLAAPKAWNAAIDALAEKVAPLQPDLLMGIESRGFLVGAPLALKLECGFGMVRKRGKLPGKTLSYTYTLEYGSDEIEIQPDLLKPGARVVLIDDLLATGGTMAAAEALVKQAGANVLGSFCIIELEGLSGRDKLKTPFEALLRCPA